MNRKERRRNGITRKPITVCLTREQLQYEIEKGSIDIKKEAIRNTVRLVTGVIALALNNKFQYCK